MKFDKIVLTGSQSITLFDLYNPLSTPYVARSIDGLGPTETDVSLVTTVQNVGLYLGQRPELREIIFSIRLNPDYTIGQTPEKLREAIYLLRPVNADASLSLKLYDGETEFANTSVYIKRIELTPFAKENDLQLTLASTQSYFEKPTPVVMTDPPFNKAKPVFPNIGSASTGFKLKVLYSGSSSRFAYYRNDPYQVLEIEYPFVAGDVLEVDTRVGTRGVWVTRGTSRISLLGNFTLRSSWVSLYPQDNAFIWGFGYDYDRFSFTHYEYQPKYIGV